MGSTHSGVSTP
jgi:hypothetical protein